MYLGQPKSAPTDPLREVVVTTTVHRTPRLGPRTFAHLQPLGREEARPPLSSRRPKSLIFWTVAAAYRRLPSRHSRIATRARSLVDTRSGTSLSIRGDHDIHTHTHT